MSFGFWPKANPGTRVACSCQVFSASFSLKQQCLGLSLSNVPDCFKEDRPFILQGDFSFDIHSGRVSGQEPLRNGVLLSFCPLLVNANLNHLEKLVSVRSLYKAIIFLFGIEQNFEGKYSEMIPHQIQYSSAPYSEMTA